MVWRMCSVTLFVVGLLSFGLVVSPLDANLDTNTYYPLPKFWTNTGFCPRGAVRHEAIRSDLLSATMQLNLRLISALPAGAITHIRIHWLLELVRFKQFSQAGIPEYDFEDLDTFLDYLRTLNLRPVIEFMGNFSNLFHKNPPRNPIVWENLTHQILKRYSEARYNWEDVKKWRFETWNEPDLQTYNTLNLNLDSYLEYVRAIRRGLGTISKEHKEEDTTSLQLRGPAGLFKAEQKHPLCWGLLAYCQENKIENDLISNCPVDILTYHRKGNGQNISELMITSQRLWQQILQKYPNLRDLPISNDEADPISGWSRARSFYSDIRYALAVVRITFEHWNALFLERKDSFKLDSISHDNAFVSYHPFEFTQRTLLAHFQMNDTNPPHSQFIQKPVYAALGLMSRLGSWASKMLRFQNNTYEMLATTSSPFKPSGNYWYFNWLLWSTSTNITELRLQFEPGLYVKQSLIKDFTWAFIAEALDQSSTNPVKVWRQFGRPAYPNATVRSAMRSHQSPRQLDMGRSEDGRIYFNLSVLPLPWLVSVRMCGRRTIVDNRSKPIALLVVPVIRNEVLITWQEASDNNMDNYDNSCLKTYEVWFQSNSTSNWTLISDNNLPFPSFHYAPITPKAVDGFYRVRGVDVFNAFGHFSDSYEYIEI